jgi:hypothetical protein
MKKFSDIFIVKKERYEKFSIKKKKYFLSGKENDGVQVKLVFVNVFLHFSFILFCAGEEQHEFNFHHCRQLKKKYYLLHPHNGPSVDWDN